MKTAEKRNIFNKIFQTRSYGSSGECHCGVMHYDATNSWDEDHHENVLPEAERNAKINPNSYQLHDSAVEFFNFNGRLYVFGCQCRMDDFMFEFFNEEKQNVLSYYKKTQDEISVNDLKE